MLEALSDKSGVEGQHASSGRSFTHAYALRPTETEANERTFWRADKRNGVKVFSSCVAPALFIVLVTVAVTVTVRSAPQNLHKICE
jgi:hypothetical protein